MKKITTTKKKIAPYILMLLSIILFAACSIIETRDPIPKRKAVFIFCDVTGSLIKEESDQVADIAANILDKLPSDAKYRLIPIHMKTESSEEILPTTGNFIGEITDSFKEARRAKLKGEIAKLYQFVNSKEQKPERTCILSGLQRARDFYLNLKENVDNVEYEYELVFISDMLEHCLTTPAGKNILVSIKDQSSSEAFQIIKNATLTDLSPFRVTIILPAKDQTIQQRSSKISVQTLNIFWSEVFKKCNNKVTLDDWLTADSPDRILKPQIKVDNY